jgi:hypothetical protein
LHTAGYFMLKFNTAWIWPIETETCLITYNLFVLHYQQF